jgi:type 1 glutamine amidotransferase
MKLVLVGVVLSCVLGGPIVAAGQGSIPRVLYLSHAAGFAHESRQHAGQVIAALGQSSGAFTVTATEDVGTLTAANLANYDAVIFFTSGELPITDQQKAALLQFVSAGKGFIGVHSATDTFHDSWPEYKNLIGGEFETHPWTQLATIRVEDQAHRSTHHLGASFQINDELYQFKNWSRANVHVLLSLDLTSVDPSRGGRMDNDYALAWIKLYGQGRVFYTALGHFNEVWDDTRFQQHVLQGIRWALGSAISDYDQDGLPDTWELAFGLNPDSYDVPNGGTGDPDGDGVTNAQELAAHTHPVGLHQRYLAEGATGTFFDTRIALVNPSATAGAHVQLRFLPEDGPVVTTEVTMPARSRKTVSVDDVPGMASASFSTTIESDQTVVVDRTMTWANGQAYGSHAETSLPGPSTKWYFAEGATHGRFDLFYLIQNPSATQTATVTASFLTSTGQQVDRVYDVEPNHRRTIPVDEIPELSAAEMAATFTSTAVPIIVERAMYLSRPEQIWAGGHASAGVTSLASRWFLAEGATGSFFDTFVLVGNPNAVDAAIHVSYLLSDGNVVLRDHVVPAHGRLTLNVAGESPQLAGGEVSTIVESPADVPVVVERAMWWKAPDWYEGHGSLATTETGSLWGVADGEAGGPSNARTYVLVATSNDGPMMDSLKLTVFIEGGDAIEKTFTNVLTRNRRLTFDIAGEFPSVVGHRFGVLVETLGVMLSGQVVTPVPRMPIVVERAMYSDANGVFWAAGSDLVGTRLQ